MTILQSAFQICLAVPLFYVAFRYFASRNSVISRLPGPPATSWILGSLVEFYFPAGDNSISVQWLRKYGTVMRFKGFLGRDRIQIADPAAIAHLFSAGPYAYEKDTVEKPRFETMFGAGLLSANGDIHRKLRKIMLPAFSTQQILPLAPIFDRCAMDVRERWSAQIKASPTGAAEIDLGMDCSFGLLNAIGEAAFGYDFDVFNKGPNTPLFQALAYMDSISSERSYRQLLLESVVDSLPAWTIDWILMLPIASGQPLKRELEVMQAVSRELYYKGLEIAALDASPRRDLLSVLVKANLQSSASQRLSQSEVVAQLMTFVNAGWGTVLSVLANAIRMLATHTNVQEKLREEMLALGDHPSAEQLQQTEYLGAVLKESIRMVGITPLERIAVRDDVIPLSKPLQLTDGSTIDALPVKKGQSLSIPVQAYNLTSDRFGQTAHLFDPERWLSEAGADLAKQNELGPGCWNGLANFGGGTRACVGNKFAMLELRIFLHRFLTGFAFRAGEQSEWTPIATLLAT